MRVEWNDKQLMGVINKTLDEVLSDGADAVLTTAQAMAPVDTRTLKSEIDIRKSKFEGGGYIVQAQGPKNYTKFYASFVEFGLSKTRSMKSQAYLRPAVKRNEHRVSAAIREALNKL